MDIQILHPHFEWQKRPWSMEHKYSGAVCKLLSPKHMQEVIFTFPQGLNWTVRDDVRKNVQSCADIHLYILASSPGTAASIISMPPQSDGNLGGAWE